MVILELIHAPRLNFLERLCVFDTEPTQVPRGPEVLHDPAKTIQIQGKATPFFSPQHRAEACQDAFRFTFGVNLNLGVNPDLSGLNPHLVP